MVENISPTLKRSTMRSKFSKLALTAILGFAVAFIFSCSDDDKNEGGKTAACRYIETMKGKTYDMCKEKEYKEGAKEDCEYDDPEDGHINGGTFYNSCPGGYTLKCAGRSGKSTYYLYDNTFQSCDEFLDWEYQ
jgi:hypothetical protein